MRLCEQDIYSEKKKKKKRAMATGSDQACSYAAIADAQPLTDLLCPFQAMPS